MRSYFKTAFALTLFSFFSANLAFSQSAFTLPVDSSTGGNWVGVYGSDGFLMANDPSSSLPHYASVTTLAPQYTWLPVTTDTRALYSDSTKASRIASTYFSNSDPGSTFSFNVNITDGATHQLAVYCLDLETTSRTQTISITDTGGNVLANSTQTLSNFHNGVYARWNISGQVIVKVTYTGGLNGVVSGLFFSSPVSLGPAPTVSFTNPTPSSGTLTGTIQLSATATSTPGISNVQFAVDGVNIGSPVLPPSVGNTYSTSWATTSVASGVHSLTATANDILGQSATATLSVNTFNAGPPPTTASFVKTDSSTKGSWVGVYGQNGYLIANDPPGAVPSYATVATTASTYTWLPVTTDPRALYSDTTKSSRIASTYFTATTFTIDVNLTDGNTHQVAIYALDLENAGRSETVSILKASDGTSLDSRPISGFGNGVYLAWNLTGHVIISVTNTGALNGVVSGLFFDPLPSPPPTAVITAPLGGTTVTGNSVTVTATAAATSPAIISSVQFQLDGVNLGAAVSSSPYTISWDSTTAKNGSHTLTAIATDSVGQHATSAGVTVTSSNAGPPAPTVSISAPLGGATVSNTTTVTASVSSSATPVSVQFQLDNANLGSAVGSPYSISWDTTTASSGPHTLTAIATDNLGQSTTSAGVSVTVTNAGPAQPTATYVKTDSTTKGSWVGVYGVNGYLIANDPPAAVPSYATVTTTAPQYTWLPSTTDVRALYTNGTATGRIASTYYSAANSGATFTFDVNLTDGNTHQIAVYALDLENSGRSQTISILKASDNTSLDSRPISGYGNGTYVVWNLTGHVIISVTNTGALNAVVSGLFFDPLPSPPPTAVITAPIGGTTVTGNAVTVTATAAATSPASVSSVQFKLDGANLGLAVGSSPYTISWDSTTAKNGSHTLTAVVTDSVGQHGTSPGVTVTSSNAGPPAPTVSVSSPTGGATVSATTTVTATVSSSATPVSVQFQLDNVNLGAAVGSPYSISWDTTTASNSSHTLTAIATDNLGQSTTSAGISVSVFNAGPPPATATYVKTDSTTKGSWVGVYGQNGYLIANDPPAALPSYATVTTTAAQYTWLSSTTDPRALYANSTATGRIASTYYSAANVGAIFTFDVNLTDGNTHQIAVYALDLENAGRGETISILKASDNTVLDSRPISAFGNGTYVVWNVTGHVIISVSNTGSLNAVVSGLLFGPPPSPPPTSVITAPLGGTTVTGNAVTVTATAAATSPATVSSVQFQLDGANLGTAVSSSPYTISWDSTTAKNGSHTLTAVVTDSAGQHGTSPGVTVTSSNAGPPAPTVSISTPLGGATVSTTTTVTASVSSSATPVSVQFQLDNANLGAAVGSPYSISWDTTTASSGPHTLTAIATDNLGQSTTSAGVSVTVTNAGPAQPAATYVKTDSTTKGSWVGVYGQNGYLIANDPPATVPGYATVTTTAPQYTWLPSTTDTRALYATSAGNARIASTYYSAANVGATFTFDVNLTDGNTHQIAVYALDLENSGRSETISILKASNNAVLDSRPISGFGNGVYVVWNLTGHVIISVSNTGALNAVASGLFFGPSVTVGPPPTITITSPLGSATVTGIATLTATTVSSPGVANVQFMVDGQAIGSPVTSTNSSFSTTWTSNSVQNGLHTLTALATDNLGQTGTSTGVSVNVSNSGPPPASATFVKLDTTTIGNWKGVYGGDGYVIPNDSNVQPPYGTVTVPSSAYTWLPSTTDPRALLKGLSLTDRISSTYFTSTTMTFDVNLTDGLIHQFALYCLDLDTNDRAEIITIKDANSGSTLSTRSLATFNGGVYEVWKISGHITITVQYTGGLNAVVAGVFFGTGAVPPVVSVTAPLPGTVSGTTNLTASATSSVGISSVQFQVDNVNVGAAVTTAPFSTPWNTIVNSSNGPHSITAIATDKLGQTTTSDPVSVTVSNSGPHPVISITAPTAATVTGTVTVTANATGALGVKTVQFQVSGTNLGGAVSGAGPLFSTSWNTSALHNGPYTLAAIATDYLGQTTSTSISVNVANGPPPTVSLTAPANGASVQGSVSLNATASSGLGAVSVQFQIDGVNFNPVVTTSPFTTTWDTTKGTNGTHTVTAVAIDILNQTTTSTNTVTVANPAPTINITNPSTGLVFATENVVANVTSPVGVFSVQFKLDGANLGALVTASPYSVSWDTTTAANGSHTLSAIATDVLGQTSNAPSIAVTVSNAAATFVNFDTVTKGNWVNVYGQEGAVIPADLTLPPAYANVGFNGATAFTYSASTTDARALLKTTTSTDRIASDFANLSGSTFDIDLSFSDLATHRVVLYFLDFASTAPSQTVSILDANSLAILNTQTIDNTAFQSGEYGLWNLSGHVLIRVASHTTNTTQTPLVSGIFFQTAPAISITAPAPGPVTGNVTITAAASSTVGVASVQFLVDGVSLTTINGAGPYSTSWTPLSSGTHILTAIATDVNGLVTTSAPVTVTVSSSASTLPGATFVKFDTTTSGSWKTVYGQDGEYIAAETLNSPPSYIRAQNLTVTNGTVFSWLDTEPQDCADSRGLKTVGPTSGPCVAPYIAGQNPSAWYTLSSESIRVTVTDGQAHQLALYCVDFDSTQRTEDITILNATTNAILDKRSISSFHNGVYLIWNITGDVIVQVTYTGASGQAYSDAVFSGLFFRTFSGAPAPAVTLTSPTTGAVSSSVNLTATATSSVGLASVRFQLDGSDLLSTIAAPGPYSEPWVTTTTPNGPHTLTAIATDTLGQTTISSPVAITLANSAAPTPAAVFITTDSVTSGSWVGTYGADGFIIPNDAATSPAYYAAVNVNGASTYSYADPTNFPEALLKSKTSATTDRISSVYFQPTDGINNTGVILLDVNLIDFQTHQVALYFMDWQASTRNVKVQVLNASTQAVLDTESIANFPSGKYLVWNLTGHVTIKITEIITDPNSAPNTVTVNGIFFDQSH